jgi:hypothetical protein
MTEDSDQDKICKSVLKRTLRMRQLMRLEGTNGTRNRDFKEPLRLGNKRTTSGIYRKTIGLEIVKRAVRISSGMRKVTDWTLWRGQPPPKRKKKLQIRSTSQAVWDH